MVGLMSCEMGDVRFFRQEMTKQCILYVISVAMWLRWYVSYRLKRVTFNYIQCHV